MAESSFTITAPPNTDIWRKPPGTDVFNAPTHPLLSERISLKSFQRARFTISAKWTLQYDQGGLLLHLLPSNVDKAAATAELKTERSTWQTNDKWLKAGIEFYQGVPYISTVAAESYSDWSIYPLITSTGNNPEEEKVTLELRRERNKPDTDSQGHSLWVYQLVLDDKGVVKERRPVREVTWFFFGEEGWNVDVEAMVARPAGYDQLEAEKKELLVQFEGVEVELREA